MIYDEQTDRYYLNEFHKKNSEGVVEDLKKQKPISREEATAQYQKLKQKKQETKNSESNR